MSYSAHQKAAKDTPVRCAILTISDTRTEETDTSGALMRQLLEEAGHEVVSKRIIPDEPDRIEALVHELAQNASCILTNGGTGISPELGCMKYKVGRSTAPDLSVREDVPENFTYAQSFNHLLNSL